MKKIIFVLTASLLCIGASAQVDLLHEFSINAGGGVSHFNIQTPGGADLLGWTAHGGIGYYYFFHPRWGVGTGAKVAMYNGGAKFKDFQQQKNAINAWTGETFDFSMKSDFESKASSMMVTVPLMFQYQTVGKTAFYCAVGAKAGIPISSQGEVKGTFATKGYSPKLMVTFEDLPDYGFVTGQALPDTKMDFDMDIAYMASAEMGVKWHLGGSKCLYAGIYVDYGLNSIAKRPQSNADMVNYQAATPAVFAYNVTPNAYAKRVAPLAAGITLRFAFGKPVTPPRYMQAFTLSGYVSDAKTQQPLVAEVLLNPAGEDSPFYRAISDANSGYYSITIPQKANMDAKVSAPDYHTREEELDLEYWSGAEGEKNFALQRSAVYTLSGFVKEAGTGNPVKSTISALIRGGDGKILQSCISDAETGAYQLQFATVGPFDLQIAAEEYFFTTETVMFVDSTEINRNFELRRLKNGVMLKGYIYDVKTRAPLQAEVILKPAGEESPLYRAVSDATTGYYTLAIPDKANMDVKVSATNYFDRIETLDLTQISGSEEEKNFTLQRSVITYTLSGFVKEEGTGVPVRATISAFLRGSDDRIVASSRSNAETGAYELQLNGAGPFDLQISAEGYFFANETVIFVDETEIKRNFELKKMKSGAKIVIENILFDTGTATLKSESYPQLNKFAALLKENPTIRIEVSGHTDNVGSAASNKTLSKNRATSVMNYLISQGISADRMESAGYGFDFPIAPNNTADGRAANRRVEMKVLD